MAKNVPLTYDSFVRDLPFSLRVWLSQKLNLFDGWEALAASIPLNYEDLLSPHPVAFVPRYETHNMFAFRAQRNPTMGVLEDWEIENCRIKHLVQALRNSSLLEAANHISRHCAQLTPASLPEPPHQQHASRGQHHQRSQAPTEDTGFREDVLSVEGVGVEEANLKAVPPPHPSRTPVEVEWLQGSVSADQAQRAEGSRPCHDGLDQMPVYSFEVLMRITRNFDTREKSQGGSRIGTGGFGDVFFGEFLGNKLAVKRLKENNEASLKQFETELKTLCAYKHENLVTLLGYCPDGTYPCLVYEYVVNGSLEDRLACLDGSSPLSVPQRLEIARGTARAIHYLHGRGVTHRDIKTANILLDEDFKPKVSDFATARTSPKTASKSIVMDNKTREIIGTTFYLDPEAIDYVIHPGLDVYSFGVVILELITGLPVFDPSRKEEDLKVYVREHCTHIVRDDDDDDDDDDDEDAINNNGTIFDLLDRRPGVEWDPSLVEKLYTLSKLCLEKRKNRATIKQVLETVNDMTDLYIVDGC